MRLTRVVQLEARLAVHNPRMPTRLLIVLCAALVLPSGRASTQPQTFDMIVRGGTVYDGTGSAGRREHLDRMQWRPSGRRPGHYSTQCVVNQMHRWWLVKRPKC